MQAYSPLEQGLLTGKVTMETTYPEGSTRNSNPKMCIRDRDSTALAQNRLAAGIYLTSFGLPFLQDVYKRQDLGPVLRVLGLLCEGTTVIRNAERLRLKESDRIAAMEAELR